MMSSTARRTCPPATKTATWRRSTSPLPRPRLRLRGLHLRPLLSASPPSPPTPAAFPLSPASSSSARAAASEYTFITVSDPAPEAEPAATSLVPGSSPTYITYLVTSARRGEHRRNAARRRFRDFVTLADRLAEAFRGHFVPPRPDKNTVESQVEGKMPLPSSTDVASRMLDGAARLPRQLLGEETVTTPQDVVQPAKGGEGLAADIQGAEAVCRV
ncbi:hypothetical protein GUJ93_ZPchr0010g10388 [Zizania palustris]|uniref:PX domain-containing protein n=1 Tax=Zizania palustris TaxID=103762 RepID=A0A8J5W9X7_ZIZPA|nr:hypothetical protein GUJ93_ZPchr0010g10388 [Zizania palustris]